MKQIQQQAPPAYLQIIKESKKIGFNQFCDYKTGFFLKGLAAAKQNGRFLELGTGTGASASWILEGMDETSTLITVDIDPAVHAVAKKMLGHDTRITFRCEEGSAFIQTMTETFDFIFADTWPGKFDLLDKTLDQLNVGGFYVIHDVLPHEKLPEEYRIKAPTLVQALRNRKDMIITEMDWSTGVLLAIKTAE
ncbi:class I SAM-dependent methyltransferase [Ectobacillus antri]|jgi:predicted O-methyltransferase YrrM|uniref:Class I SAM-dependent methyltransferase n=1 Tax=Ectobacillus antri TaxID=2486280 RepID=A0ABT6H9H8_9BACI|nr:class I SAM-dependent methyltransferase [Ectobacillus antri]MDG4658244.1 class I SAM-dependent methyltransferase [Ectobacillus antri]MDG5755330.1 class I SAM-dependent methyltransferase [Ectobacillus antri]